jgi:hypothetical protein
MPVNNGKRVNVAFGAYAGPAGVVEQDGLVQVAFPAVLRTISRTLKPGDRGKIGDASVEVIELVAGLNKGMVVLIARASPEAPAEE